MNDSEEARASCPPDLHQDDKQWLQLWRNKGQSSFHRLTVSPLLSRYWITLKLKRSHRVLVPLCGKSLDIVWLADQGHEVVGVELSPIAIEAFFRENNLQAKKQRIGNFVRWRAKTISIWCGDFFSLRPTHIGRIDAVFDRAALTALPSEIRGAYIEQLLQLTGLDAEVLLLTVEDTELADPLVVPPIDRELEGLCLGHYSIQLLHSEPAANDDAETRKDVTSYAKVYRLTRSGPV